MKLEAARALVTGSTSGIGEAIALRLATDGAQVVITGRDGERGDAVVAAIEAGGGRASFIAADLSTSEGARALAKAAIDRLGAIDVLVNNAGSYHFAPVAAISDEQFDEMVALNLRATHVLGAELLPQMAARGHGAVINVTSVAAYAGSPGGSVYGATKAAVDLLTKAWAYEFGPAGVRVNAVSPGPTHTPGTSATAEAIDAMTAGFPLGRAAAAQEIAAATAFLASDEASYVQGATVDVDGGARSALVGRAA